MKAIRECRERFDVRLARVLHVMLVHTAEA